LKPEDHAYALQMYFIRQFRRTINIYIDQEVQNQFAKLKTKQDKDFEERVDAVVEDKIGNQLKKQKAEIMQEVKNLFKIKTNV
jgi:hypothetical protein